MKQPNHKKQSAIIQRQKCPKARKTQPRQLATEGHPVTGARRSRYTGGYSYAMAALEHIDEIRKLTKDQVSYTGLLQCIGKDPVNSYEFGQYITHMLLTQYGITKDLQLFKSEGIDAVLKDLKQMHALKCIELLHPSQVTKDMHQKVLNYLMFLTQKKTGIVKGRGCADGQKKKHHLDNGAFGPERPPIGL